MNLMTLQRFKNELILLFAILFALFAYGYKLQATNEAQEKRVQIANEISEINTILALKKQWGGKGMGSRVKVLETIVPREKVNSFKKSSNKLTASYQNLTAKELNNLTNKLINIPVQIDKLKVTEESKNKYKMEFTCKW